MAHDKEVEPTPEELDQWHAVYLAATDIDRILREWGEACEKVMMIFYLTCQDHGLVEPFYDPMSTAGSTEEEWDIFCDAGPAYE